MIVRVRIIDGPLTREAQAAALAGAATDAQAGVRAGDGRVGAALRFEGVVRCAETDAERPGGERDVAALDYQTYDPMAERQLAALAGEIGRKHDVHSIVVLHSRGRVGVGEVSFVLSVEAAHRTEALAAMAEFIDRMKRDVPIWKRPVWAERERGQ